MYIYIGLILPHISDLRSDEDALLELSRIQSWGQGVLMLEDSTILVYGIHKILH